MININQPSVAILIDFWVRADRVINENARAFFDNPESESIETVVLASYNCYDENNSLWHWNYNTVFNSPGRKQTLVDLHFMQKFFNENYRPYTIERTHPKILNYVNHNKFQIAMHWGWEFEYYLSLNPHIKNVYVFGQAWEECVRIRPLGYESLLQIPNINVLTKLNCVKLENGYEYPNMNDYPCWEQLKDDIYYYKR